jgi:hypothetical protein
VKATLTEMNKWDIMLYAYAQSLLAYRLKFVEPLVDAVKSELGISVHSHVTTRVQASAKDALLCDSRSQKLSREMTKQLGVFRPPKHKAPL